jgi:hypothetical protein
MDELAKRFVYITDWHQHIINAFFPMKDLLDMFEKYILSKKGLLYAFLKFKSVTNVVYMWLCNGNVSVT